MKVNVNLEKVGRIIPEVGEFWAHACSPDMVYFRVHDKIGEAVFRDNGRIIDFNHFYSIEINTGFNGMVFTRFDDKTIIVLEPVNNVLELTPKGHNDIRR